MVYNSYHQRPGRSSGNSHDYVPVCSGRPESVRQPRLTSGKPESVRMGYKLILLIASILANSTLTAAAADSGHQGVLVSQIEFSQDTCNPKFNGIGGETVTTIPERFHTIVDAVDAMLAPDGKSSDEPMRDLRDAIEQVIPKAIRGRIEIVQMKAYGKRWFSADNRRLLLFKMIREHYDVDFVPPQIRKELKTRKYKKSKDAMNNFARQYHKFTADLDNAHTIDIQSHSPSQDKACARLERIPAFLRVMGLPDLVVDEDPDPPASATPSPKPESEPNSEPNSEPKSLSTGKSSTTMSIDMGVYGNVEYKTDDDVDDFFGRRRRLFRESKRFQLTPEESYRDFRRALRRQRGA